MFENRYKLLFSIFALGWLISAGTVRVSAQTELDGGKSTIPAEANSKKQKDVNKQKNVSMAINKPKGGTSPRTKRPVYIAQKNFPTTPLPVQPQNHSSSNMRVPQLAYTDIGVTIWRLSSSNEGTTKELIDPADVNAHEVYQIVTALEPLINGDRITITLDLINRPAWLYIINREVLPDGTKGVPRLIFPTNNIQQRAQTYPGGRAVLPGAGRTFKVETKNQGAAESLTIILSPYELPELTPIGNGAMRLPEEKVKNWEAQWQVNVSGASLKMYPSANPTNGISKEIVDPADGRMTNPPQQVYRLTSQINPNDGSLIAPQLFTIIYRGK